MDITRRGNKLTLELDPDDAIGLHAVLSGNHALANKQQLERGTQIYAWFYEAVKHLATIGPG